MTRDAGTAHRWRGVHGMGLQTRIFAGDGLNVLAGERVRLVAGPYTRALFDDAELDVPDPERVTYEKPGSREGACPHAPVLFDDAELDVPDPSVTTYAYDAEHSQRECGARQAFSAENAERDANELTAVTEDGRDTYYSYDAWGRTSSKWRGDGTSVHAEYTWKMSLVTRPSGRVTGDAGHSLRECPGKRRNKYVNTTKNALRKPAAQRLPCAGGDVASTRQHPGYRWAGWNVIADYTGDGSWTVGARTMSYTPGLVQAPGANPTTAPYQYSMADHLGSVRQITAQDKSVLAHYAYTPYGETGFAAGLAMTHGFTGHRWDAESGLYFAPFRYYAPQNARWMKRDPIKQTETLGMYAYVKNNPITYIDLYGTFRIRTTKHCQELLAKTSNSWWSVWRAVRNIIRHKKENKCNAGDPTHVAILKEKIPALFRKVGQFLSECIEPDDDYPNIPPLHEQPPDWVPYPDKWNPLKKTWQAIRDYDWDNAPTLDSMIVPWFCERRL